jgi:two-component system response regulator QseB
MPVPTMHILIVEDDRQIAENLYDYLEAHGHQCDYAFTLSVAKRLLEQPDIDTLVLDRSLPDGDGLTLAQALRDQGRNLPILVLTARDGLDDKLLGFEAGIDDYLTKPFALQELEARLLALQRRLLPSRPANAPLCQGPLRYEPAAQTLSLNEQPLRLPPKAFRLIEVLLQHPNRVLSRRELELAVWGQEQAASDNLRSLLHSLRKSFGPNAGVEVVNIHGMGYKLVCHPD